MFKIKNRLISKKNKPFIIAEMSGNHAGSISRALKIVDLVAKSGADAIKLQTYTADTMTIKSHRKEFFITNKKNLWKGNSLHQLYSKASTPWEWHKKIFQKAKKLGLICFSSPFDESAVDFLESLNVPAYKIASFENEHYPLLKKIAQTKKPVIMSTGMINLKKLKESVKFLRKNGCKQLALLKCTSSYPAEPKDLNLNSIPLLKRIFKCEIGFSDHTIGIGSCLSAISLGATIIEKHVTYEKGKGIDGAFSSNSKEIMNLSNEANNAWQSIGKKNINFSKSEKKYLIYKRSIYSTREIKKGEKLSYKNIKVIRPSLGLHPKYFFSILGKKAKKKIPKGSPIKLQFIKK